MRAERRKGEGGVESGRRVGKKWVCVVVVCVAMGVLVSEGVVDGMGVGVGDGDEVVEIVA